MKDKVQLIKEEIESYRESMKGLEPHSDFRRGQITAYNQIMQFINSLPEEHNEDLEEEIKCYIKKEFPDGIGFPNVPKIARHFAEWQKEKHNKQFGFLNLKDCKDAYNRWKSTQDDNPSAALAWVRACEWQKQQMMKDAVEGEVVYQIGSSVLAPTDIRYKVVSDRVYIPNVKLGDKVKIIIVKED